MKIKCFFAFAVGIVVTVLADTISLTRPENGAMVSMLKPEQQLFCHLDSKGGRKVLDNPELVHFLEQSVRSFPKGIELTWVFTGVRNQVRYEITLADNEAFANARVIPVENEQHFTLYNLFNGKTYYWRMKAYNAIDTSAWSTAYRFTTPAAISQTSPANGSAMTAVSITLQWNTLTGSTYYYVECDTSQSFNSPLHITDSINGSSKTILFHYGKTYYWRVKACNENDTTQWSLPWSFTTPAAVTLSSPADYYQNTTLSASLSWSSISGTSKYEAQWDTSASFNSPLLGSGTTTSTSKSASVLHYGKTYFWRVRAMNAVDTSAWSLVRHFMTPSSFNLSSPSDSSAIANVKATLSWKSISCDQYICQYDTNAYFSSPAIQTIATTTTSCTASDLYYGARYHWRVAAVSSVDTSAWTAAWTFTTPASVTLKSPADNSTINANTQKLTWNTFTGNTYYDYQYDTTPNFNSTMLYTASCSSGTSAVTVSNLMFCTTYYWRVRARNNNDISR